MKIVKPSATLLNHKDCNSLQWIEKIGRICYKSEDKITKNSAEKFVKGLKNNGHYAMLEHERLYFVYMHIDNAEHYNGFDFFLEEEFKCVADMVGKAGSYYDLNHFVEVSVVGNKLFLSFPLRALVELDDELWDMQLISEENKKKYLLKQNIPNVLDLIGMVNDDIPIFHWTDHRKETFWEKVSETEFKNFLTDALIVWTPLLSREIEMEVMKHISHTVLFTCDRGVSHELVRHRVASFAQESTRYCNYAKGKFGEEITVIEPFFFKECRKEKPWLFHTWAESVGKAESTYIYLINEGATPQEARTVLPNSLKTDIIVTATEREWQHIVNLRYLGLTGQPHPQMKEVMSLIVEDLSKVSNQRINVNETNE